MVSQITLQQNRPLLAGKLISGRDEMADARVVRSTKKAMFIPMNIKDSEIIEQIAELLENLPSDYLFQPDLLTPDQINEWHKLREDNILLAKTWRSHFHNQPSYFLDEAVDRKEISQHKRDLILLMVKQYIARWELCQVAEKYVKSFHLKLQDLTNHIEKLPQPLRQMPRQIWYKFFQKVTLKEYPFQSAYDLFAQTLIEEKNETFSCSFSYYEVPIKKWGQATKQITEILDKSNQDGTYPQLKLKEVENLKSKLVWDKVGFSWLGLTLFVCQLEAPKNKLLREKLITYNQSLKEALTLAVTASRKIRGFAWDKGKIVYSSSSGGVYRQN
ncbi:hypothetical protein [Floridanema aerugineum]|uniref:Uncharacterized protein n=1 Tax=Floridaenema aerugineum BLCC-F46 TaxID=3153654 RepID=A0ABV4XFF1_9CYAN